MKVSEENHIVRILLPLWHQKKSTHLIQLEGNKIRPTLTPKVCFLFENEAKIHETREENKHNPPFKTFSWSEALNVAMAPGSSCTAIANIHMKKKTKSQILYYSQKY